ncbi:MAG: M23 family metallopeptidase [Oscillospiraceae bacterium]|nr:M23 family metallopeptidase [Oscillospiraceae bacterium]
MRKEYFTENISDETIVNMIDRALKFEKNVKDKNIKIFKIIPAAAAILLVIGLVNILPVINFTGGEFIIGNNAAVLDKPVEEYEDISYIFEEQYGKPFFIIWRQFMVESFFNYNNGEPQSLTCDGATADRDITEVMADFFDRNPDECLYTYADITGTIDVPELNCRLIAGVYEHHCINDNCANKDSKMAVTLDIIGDKDEIRGVLGERDVLDFATAEWGRLHEKIENETEAIHHHIRELLIKIEKNNPREYAGGEMQNPLDIEYPFTILPFGERIHPITGRVRLHTGVDISAADGANIYAANDGTVITAEWNEIYGNFIAVDHGGGIVTLYANAKSLEKKAGDTVKRGDIIATVGSTGWSTGVHLHFEIIVNGTPQNPFDGWISTKFKIK